MPQQRATGPKHPRTRCFVAQGLFYGLDGFADIQARIATLPTEQERGDAFEVFTEAYLGGRRISG